MKSKRQILVSLSIFLVFACLLPVHADNGSQERDFSFIVFGDSRLPGFVPYRATEQEQIQSLIKEILIYAYGTSSGFKTDMVFDPDTGELNRIKIQPPTGVGSIDTFYRNGWPYLILEEAGGKSWVTLRSEGQDWVYRRVASELKKGAADPKNGPSFCLHTGDITYSGFQGKGLDQSPYWQHFFDHFLNQIPPGGPWGLPARFFPALGNHETWFDENIEGTLSTMPYLQKMGLTPGNRIYKFDRKGCRFIFLDSGSLDVRRPSDWTSRYPDFQTQMSTLQKWLKEAKKSGMRRVFITFHYPVYCLAEPPLLQQYSPHPYIKPFASDLDITVFTGHIHSTELYLVDGVRYLVVGGGGGEQSIGTFTPPPGYPSELYWNGQPRVEEYNYLLVQVSGKNMRMWLYRFRPSSSTPFEKVEVFNSP